MASMELIDSVTGQLRTATTEDFGGGGGGNSQDRELVVTTYFVKTAFTDAAIGDTVTATQVIDVHTSNPHTITTIWRNQTTATDLTATPNAANLELVGSQALTDAQLRASPVPVSLADVNWSTTYAYNASNQITSETRTDGSTTQTRTYSYDANGNLTGIGAWV